MAKNREVLNPNAKCVPARNFCEHRLIPLTKAGNPYRPGFRICKNFDCVALPHITQSRYIARKIYGKNMPRKTPPRNIIADPKQLIKVAKPLLRGAEPKTCQLPGCPNPHRATNLCNAHHNQLYKYRKQNEFKRFRQDYSGISQYVQPPKGADLTMKDRYCHVPDCEKEYFARGLCKFHHKRWMRYEGITK